MRRVPQPRSSMIPRRSRLRWLVPLWLAAALLLAAGLVSAGAQDPAGAAPQAADSAGPAAGGASGSATGEQSGSVGQTGNVTAAQRARLAREEAQGGTLAERLVSLLGLVVFVGLAWLMSTHRGAVHWGTVAWGLGLQFIFAAIILLTTPGRWVFEQLNVLFTNLLGYTTEGARFIFGNLVLNNIAVLTAGTVTVAATGTVIKGATGAIDNASLISGAAGAKVTFKATTVVTASTTLYYANIADATADPVGTVGASDVTYTWTSFVETAGSTTVTGWLLG